MYPVQCSWIDKLISECAHTDCTHEMLLILLNFINVFLFSFISMYAFDVEPDVIDWILDNLIEKSRTRRGVMKKMKELGLVFKAPTKRSTANAKNKRIQMEQQEDMSGLEKIVPARKTNALLKKGGKKVVVPKKKKVDAVKALDIGGVKKIIDELAESLRGDILNWLEESIRDAVEDIADDDPSDDPDDGVPLVPINGEQRDAMDNTEFCGLLKALGFQPPVEGMVSIISFIVNVGYNKQMGDVSKICYRYFRRLGNYVDLSYF